jgi:hypothetical protein
VLLQTAEPARLGPERRPSALPLPDLDERLGAAFGEAKLTPALENLIRATVYLWHDHLDASHQIAQEIENSDGSLVHGIMHRREPDYSNAKYWFRRVGSHPSFLALAVRASEALEKSGDSDLHSRLVPNKMWDPFAFVDAVEDAETGKFQSQIPSLERLQALEFECLIENLLNRL